MGLVVEGREGACKARTTPLRPLLGCSGGRAVCAGARSAGGGAHPRLSGRGGYSERRARAGGAAAARRAFPPTAKSANASASATAAANSPGSSAVW